MGAYIYPIEAEWPGRCYFCFGNTHHTEGTQGYDLKVICETCNAWCIDSMSIKYNGLPRWIKWK